MLKVNMAEQTDLVTVFRSADDAAEEDVTAIAELLSGQNLNPVVLNDSAPGVPEGAWEVQVPAAESERAERLISEARLPDDDVVNVDESPEFDSETVFRASGGSTAELEAMSVKSVLEGAGIGTFIVGDSVLPNLAFEVRVAREHADRARQLLAEAEAAGPAAAEEAERATE
jgi:hypothetical protein